MRQVYGGTALGAGVAAAAGGGGGYEFKPEEIDGVIARWESLRDEFLADQQAIDAMLGVMQPPAEDQASTGFTRSVSDGLSSLYDSNMSMLDYVNDYIAKLKDAKGATENADASNAESAGSFMKAFEA
ncbi:hypothetical protein CFN78_10595 [Amycolatopsis antarctica]|uniref:PE domain-containing protein n=1 Tax=Amycolatopsis antarctica TaxID=1854586 RepID=A0A263D6U2_9PSEU|nr:hypothetical protein CFN78_10595 [Amycolatopsis antarctica]